MFDWKNPLFRFGAWTSFCWLVAGVAVMAFAGNWSGGIKPNEWGDIFAGLFAPVAFLWLVLGFVQQGQELQLSTKALNAQVEELRHTVQNQRELVEVTREQVSAAMREEQRQAEASRLVAQPRFMLSQAGSSSTGTVITYTFQMRNIGAVAANIRVTADQGKTVIFPTMANGEQNDFKMALDPEPTAARKVQSVLCRRRRNRRRKPRKSAP